MVLISWASNTVMANTEEGFDEWTLSLEEIRMWKYLSKVTNQPYEYRVSKDGEVMLRTGKYKHVFSEGEFGLPRNDQIPRQFQLICENFYGTRLQSIETKSRHNILQGGRYPKLIKANCLSRANYQNEVAEAKALRRGREQSAEIAVTIKANSQKRQNAQILAERKESCTTYGFTPGTDGHSKCVMELAIAADASEKQRITNANRAAALAIQAAAANAASEAAAEDARKQRQAQALINLGSSISSGGAPYRSSTSSPTAPPSSGRYKTCSYRVAGDIVPMTVSRAEACSATKLIGGQTGYLAR